MWIHDLKAIYNLYPRRFFTTSSWEIKSFDELLEAFSRNISHSRCSSSIYNFQQDDGNIVLDRIAFDLDSKHSHDDAIKLHDYFSDKDIKHYMVFSGENFHVYAKVEGNPIFKKECLRNMHVDIAKKVGVENDSSIRGSLSHNLSIPYSYNFKRKRYVRFLSEHELYLEHDIIRELAKKQGGSLKTYGSQSLSTDGHDRQIVHVIEQFEESENDFVSDKLLNALPNNCKQALTNPDLTHPECFLLITRLQEFGLSKAKIMKVLRDHLTERNFYHRVFEERMIDNVFRQKFRVLEEVKV